jgi:galactokinase
MEKSVVVFAPGRVELLGNHTDYNEGLALAAAIDLGIARRRSASSRELDSERLQSWTKISIPTVDITP